MSLYRRSNASPMGQYLFFQVGRKSLIEDAGPPTLIVGANKVATRMRQALQPLMSQSQPGPIPFRKKLETHIGNAGYILISPAVRQLPPRNDLGHPAEMHVAPGFRLTVKSEVKSYDGLELLDRKAPSPDLLLVSQRLPDPPEGASKVLSITIGEGAGPLRCHSSSCRPYLDKAGRDMSAQCITA